MRAKLYKILLFEVTLFLTILITSIVLYTFVIPYFKSKCGEELDNKKSIITKKVNIVNCLKN